MGTVCAKNDAGKVATDAPRPPIRKNKDLMSSQKTGKVAETKFVSGQINFNLDKGVEKKAD